MTDNKHFKIGISDNVELRAKAHSISLGREVSIIAQINTYKARELERCLLFLYQDNPYINESFQGYTEWRALTPKQLDCILTYFNTEN